MTRKGLKFDVPLCLGVLALVGVGMVLIYSSSASVAVSKGLPESFYLAQHVKRVLIGLIAFLVALAVPYRVWERFAAPMVLFAIAMLAFVFVSGVGSDINGARRWISFADYGLQPSELAKIAVIFYLARRLAEKSRSGEIMRFGRGLTASLLIPLLVFGLILLQPNFSTAATVSGITVALVFVAGARPAHLLLLGGTALPVLIGLMLSSDYRRQRVMAFFDPSANPASSYQSEQALISLGNGGLLGTGLGEGTQKLGYLPMPFTDTVFAILGEELGFLGTMFVMFLFGIIVWRGLRIARACPDRFGSLLATGLTVSIALNVVMHIGVCVSLFPTTGQPLPFVSYGGTSLVANLVAMGVLLNVSGSAQGVIEPAAPLVWRAAGGASPLRSFAAVGGPRAVPQGAPASAPAPLAGRVAGRVAGRPAGRRRA